MTPEQHARVKQLFASAASLAPTEREAFFQRHASEEPSVLAELRSLLQHHKPHTLLSSEDDTQTHVNPQLSPRRSHDSMSGASSFFLLKLGPQGTLALGIGLTCVMLGLVNYLTRRANQSTIHELRTTTLMSGLNITVEALELWIEQEKNKVEVVARDPELQRQTQQLAQLAADNASADALIASSSAADLRKQLVADFGSQVKYAVWDRQMITIADWNTDGDGVGDGVSAHGAALLTRVFEGQTAMEMSGRGEAITKDDARLRQQPTIGVIAPIRDDQGGVIAAILVYGMGAEERFCSMLDMVRFGRTGETFAFDQSGLMLSESRYVDQLRTIGLLKPDEKSTILRTYLRDPGVDLTKNPLPPSPPDTWPLTKMVRFATSPEGRTGVDLDGYRDYRGVLVVGAWKWLDKYHFGVATELEVAELNAALKPLKVQSAFKFGLLALSMAATVASYYSLARLRRRVGTDSLVGQYTLEEKIGEGGMGVVYKARHALLKRPTALKLLKSNVASRRTVAWFEREVQLASQLTHPNTIAIYDYGSTPEGLFYYVMEFLQGGTLVELVARDGPLEPGRVVHILRQVGGSLREAHHIGLVHRDIKPQNIMLCQRACETDVVKVLDFGLVKQIQEEGSAASTVLAGTPLYMAPERISAPGRNDPGIDIYALGAVGFFLLTGREIFTDTDSSGILHHVLHTIPPRVSDCVEGPVPAELDDLIAGCLAKDPAARPANMDAVLAVLDQLELTTPYLRPTNT